jgi:hypothetical protein
MQFITYEYPGSGRSLAAEKRFWRDRLRAQIGRDLQSKYRDILDEPLPENLAALLEQLDDRQDPKR